MFPKILLGIKFKEKMKFISGNILCHSKSTFFWSVNYFLSLSRLNEVNIISHLLRNGLMKDCERIIYKRKINTSVAVYLPLQGEQNSVFNTHLYVFTLH